jgi:hypothetical protein
MVMFVHLTPKKNLKAVMPSESHEGCEVIIGLKITSGEIRRVCHLPQVIGWRYMSGALKLSTCICAVYNPPGTINSRKKWQAGKERQG